jgi:hypothetical protein
LRAAPRVPDHEALQSHGQANKLFVGPIAPNNKIEDHIRQLEHNNR